MEAEGIAPSPQDFQSRVRTSYTTLPLLLSSICNPKPDHLDFKVVEIKSTLAERKRNMTYLITNGIFNGGEAPSRTVIEGL